MNIASATRRVAVVAKFSAVARFEAFDPCRRCLLNELQHEFAVASPKCPSHFRKHGSKQNQSWRHGESYPRVSGRVVTPSEHVEQGEHKYRGSAKDSERKPETHEISRPARSIEIALDSAASGLSFNRPIELTCEIVAAVPPLLQPEGSLSNFTEHRSLTFIAREREQCSLFGVNGTAQCIHHGGWGKCGMQQDRWASHLSTPAFSPEDAGHVHKMPVEDCDRTTAASCHHQVGRVVRSNRTNHHGNRWTCDPRNAGTRIALPAGSEAEEDTRETEEKNKNELVGTGRFELPTPRTPSECSTRLSHVPTEGPTASAFHGVGLTKDFTPRYRKPGSVSKK